MNESVPHTESLENQETMAESGLGGSKAIERMSLKTVSLTRGDSGYLSPNPSPISPATPSSEHSTPSRTSFQHLICGGGAAPGRSSTAPAAAGNPGEGMMMMQRDGTPPRPYLLRQGSSPVLGGERTLGDNWFQSMNMLQKAFQCRQDSHALSQPWGHCSHPYCVHIKRIWDHWSRSDCVYRDCTTCQHLVELLERHSEQCRGDGACPVEGCQAMTKRRKVMANGYSLGSARRSGSSIGVQTDNVNGGVESDSARPRPHLNRGKSLSTVGRGFGQSGFLSLTQADILMEDSLEMKRISDMAERIVNRLDQEEPLLPNSDSKNGQYVHSNSIEETPHCYESFHSGLYPIVEHHSPTFINDPHFMSFSSGSFGRGPMSSELDGIINRGENGALPSMGASSNAGASNNSQGGLSSLGGLNSLGGEQDDATSYPQQTIKFQLKTDILTVGQDSHYFQRRDYNATDTPDARGGFGSINFCTDLTTKQMFAMKQNSKDEQAHIESIHTEASLLSKLGEHDNVIQMYGAVLDELESDFQPPRVYKMMMELAEHGNLSGMLVDEAGCPSPLEADQGLYYFRQLLLGVKFLHDSNVLHLDIKGLNLLVFDEGKTLKLCDFGTAVRMDDMAASGGRKNCMTPLFAAPEICREEPPRFSADIWSCMCVLVEMLTALTPWKNKINKDSSQFSMMFVVGSYRDEAMETDLVPCVETLAPELLDLMRLVFRANHKERSTALELLSHPLIINAGEYEACFDGCGEEIYEEEGEEECCNEMEPSLGLSQAEVAECSNSNKRLSKDSGTGSDIEQDSLRGMYSRKSSHGRNSDSGLDTPCPDKNIFFSPCPEESDRDLSEINREITSSIPVLRQHSHGVLSLSSHMDSYCLTSLPTSLQLQHQSSISPSHPVPCSLSVTWPSFHSLGSSYSAYLPCESHVMVHQCSCPVANSTPAMGGGGVSRLRHSNSAPSIGTSNHRRHSLQPLYSMSSDGQILFNVGSSRRNMRRSSSELYASSGPDIDSPEGRKKFLGLESPTRKEAASQTQDPEEEDAEERDGGLPQPISIRLSHPDTNSVTALPAHSMPTSEEGITGDVSSNIASSSSSSDQRLQKYEDKTTEALQSRPKTADADAQENGRGVDVTTTTTVESRGTFYETIC